MASRIELFSPTIPAGTLQSAPLNVPFVFNDGVVQRIEILVPPGPSGLVGFAITHSGSIVIPYDGTSFFVTDDEKLSWDVEDFPTGSAWGVRAFNTDVYPHKLYFRFLVRETTQLPSGNVPLLDIAQIAPANDEPALEEVL